MEDKVKLALDKIRPMLQAEGGDLEFVGLEDGVVKIHLKGSCTGCPMSGFTLTMVIERILRKEIPEIKKVVAI